MSWNKKSLKSASLLTITALALTACDSSELDFAGPIAGDELNRSGSLGVATQINAGVQTIPTEEMLRNLTRLFASEVPATINFDFNSAELDEAARSALRAQARWILDHPAVKFRVFGHTDRVGSNTFNIRLGKRRADAAVEFMISLGVPRDRLEGVASLGETRPVVLTEARNRQNRRTVTEVVAFIRPFDGQLDGKYAINVYNSYVATGSGEADAE